MYHVWARKDEGSLSWEGVLPQFKSICLKGVIILLFLCIPVVIMGRWESCPVSSQPDPHSPDKYFSAKVKWPPCIHQLIYQMIWTRDWVSFEQQRPPAPRAAVTTSWDYIPYGTLVGSATITVWRKRQSVERLARSPATSIRRGAGIQTQGILVTLPTRKNDVKEATRHSPPGLLAVLQSREHRRWCWSLPCAIFSRQVHWLSVGVLSEWEGRILWPSIPLLGNQSMKTIWNED